jgi:hypothetical protein
MQCFLWHIIAMLGSERCSHCSFTSMLSISLPCTTPHLKSMASNLCRSASFLLDLEHGRGAFLGYVIMVFHCYSLTILFLLHIEMKYFADRLLLRYSLSPLKLPYEGSQYLVAISWLVLYKEWWVHRSIWWILQH